MCDHRVMVSSAAFRTLPVPWYNLGILKVQALNVYKLYSIIMNKYVNR